MHDHPPVDPNKPVNPDSKDNDIDLKLVQKFLIGSLVVAAITMVVMLAYVKFLRGSYESEGRGEIEVRNIAQGSNQLQTNPRQDLKDYLEMEHARLNTYTNTGEVLIMPIDVAMEAMIHKHAFPVRENSDEAETDGDSNYFSY